MKDSKLTPEVVSLIHHIELSKAGWWPRAVQQFISAVLWFIGDSLSPERIADELARGFGMRLHADAVRDQLQPLCESGTLVRLPDGKFKLTESAQQAMEANARGAEAESRDVEGTFARILGVHCQELEASETWRVFGESLLTPLIQELGARSYELISGAKVNVEERPRFREFLESYPETVRQRLRNTIVEFLDPHDPKVRSYVLRQLNAYFIIEAGNLSRGTIDILATAVKTKPSFAVYVDTNFLFSILGLHENPSNEAAETLMALATELRQLVELRLVVAPITVDETRKVLEAAQWDLSNLHLSPNLADAALMFGLSGLGRKFAEECLNAGRALRATDYFGPYVTDLIEILKSKGVEPLDIDVDRYTLRPDVVDDLNSQLEFEKRKFPDRAKGYEQLMHDMVLWHLVVDQRPSNAESPLDAGCWIVTVDLRLLGFDRFKRGQAASRIPVCVHPATLMQLLQFWVPRTPQFEAAILSSLRLPFLFQNFDPAAERMTVRILEALSRFENVGDLSRDTVRSILLNQALRQRLPAHRDLEKEVDLVRDALIEEHSRVEADLVAARAAVERLEHGAETSTETIARLTGAVTTGKERARVLEERLDEEAKARRETEKRVRQLEESAEREEARKAEVRAVRGFTARWVVIPLLVCIAAASSLTALVGWQIGGIALGLSLIGWLWLVDLKGSRLAVVSDAETFGRFQKLKNWVFGVLGLLVLAVAGNGLYDVVKSG